METLKQTPATASGEYADRPSERREGAFHETGAGWAVLALVWTASVAYLATHLRQGWVPSDAGTLAEMAQRVLRGQVPFRDFIEGYSGGLDYLNALSFRVFGVNLFSLRIPLFLLFLGWVPAVYLIARRFIRPLTAGAITLLAVAWSVPNYPGATPSWYNLFFATWGVLALLRHTETEKRRWLWVAGLCGGLSFLAKITALYFLAAALLFFVFRELSLSRAGESQPSSVAWLYRLFGSAGLLLFFATLVDLISQRPLFANYIYFVLPCACLVAILLWRMWREKSSQAAPRFRRLLAMGVPSVIGFLIPIVVFLAWLARKNALHPWFSETFPASTTRLQWAGGNPAPLGIFVGLVPTLLILYLAGQAHPAIRRVARYGSFAILPALLVLAWRDRLVYAVLGYALPLSTPLIGVSMILGLGRPGARADEDDQKVFLLASTAVCCALIQFPLSAPIYFCYVAPLTILATVALLSLHPNFDRVALGSLLAFYLVFGIWLHAPAHFEVFKLSPRSEKPQSLRKLSMGSAGGILVSAGQAEEYEKLVSLVRAHARGPFIYCTPDCPEVYFLSGERNPTRTLWDFADPDFLDSGLRTARILWTIRNYGVAVVVLRNNLVQSGPVLPGLRSALRALFPDARTVGEFEVRWKP